MPRVLNYKLHIDERKEELSPAYLFPAARHALEALTLL